MFESTVHGALKNSEFPQSSNLQFFLSHSTTDKRYSEGFPAFQPEPTGSWRKWANHDSRWPLLLQQSEQRDWWYPKGTRYDKATVDVRTTGKIEYFEQSADGISLAFLFGMADTAWGTPFTAHSPCKKRWVLSETQLISCWDGLALSSETQVFWFIWNHDYLHQFFYCSVILHIQILKSKCLHCLLRVVLLSDF